MELKLLHTKTLTSLCVHHFWTKSGGGGQSKLTLAILLVVFICQILATGSAFSVQYPGGEHPMGVEVNHHHAHGVSDGVSFGNSQAHGHAAFNATESVNIVVNFQVSADTDVKDSGPTLALSSEPTTEDSEAEHEHGNHSHTPSHLPIDTVFISGFYQSETLIDDDISYLNFGYAPPIPPPHA